MFENSNDTHNRWPFSTIMMAGKPTTIRVVAPATLEAGYQFDVLVDNEPLTVTVPEGGVEEGQEFDIVIDDDDDDAATVPAVVSSEDEADDDAKTGTWRVSLCSCCSTLTQATFWMGFCCTPVLIAQLLARLRLNWKGEPESDEEELSLSFNRIVIGFIAALMLGYLPVIGWVALLIYWLAVVIAIGSAVRRQLRRRYGIRSRCEPIEDGLCLTLCSCCAVIQMARQTHNDKEYPGYCCTRDGLEPSAPQV